MSKKKAVPQKVVAKKHAGKVIDPAHVEEAGKLLGRGQKNAVTIRTLARKMKCSKAAAERRVNAYLTKTKGFEKLFEKSQRELEELLGPGAKVGRPRARKAKS